MGGVRPGGAGLVRLQELLDGAGLSYGEHPESGLFVAFTGQHRERVFVTLRELGNETLLFATELPASEPASEAALRNLLRVADQGSLLKPMLVTGGQLILGLEVPSALANPQIAEAAVKGLAFLADVSPENLEHWDPWERRIGEWNQGLAGIASDPQTARESIPEQAREHGWECQPLGDTDWLVKWMLAVPGGPSMAVGLRVRLLSGVVSCTVLVEGARPRGDIPAYLRRLLQLSGEASVAKLGLTEDDDVAVLYQEPRVSSGLMERLDHNMGLLLLSLLMHVSG